MVYLFWITIFVSFILFIVVFFIWLVAAALQKENIVNVCVCILTWITLFFLLPYVAKKFNVIKEKWIAILLMMVSPAIFVVSFYVGTEYMGISPYQYKDLEFTSKSDIICLTRLPDFPDYDYHNNSLDYWNGEKMVRFLFKEEPPATFYDKLESLRTEKDNVYWSRVSLEYASDRDFFGSDHIYICSRGWDGKFIPSPSKDMIENATVQLCIGKRGFVCRYKEYDNISLDKYGNRDSISALLGVQFPTYKNVYCRFTPIGPDWGEEWTILLDKKPNKEFILQIKQSPNWTKWENNPGHYEFRREIPMKSYDKIIIDENSRVVRVVHGTY